MKLKKLHIALIGLSLAGPASALNTGIKGFTFDGRARVGAMALTDLQGQGTQMGPFNYLGEVKASYRPNRSLTFLGDIWIRGMMNDPGYTDPKGGLKLLNPALGMPSGSFKHGTANCNPAATGEFCAKNNRVDRFDDFDDEMIRELSVKYRDPKRRFTVKAGKFQRGWGQSDGLRLLDILHAQDLRERFVYKDTDELRIPAWMISADLNLSKLGMRNAFKSIGIKRPTLEFNIVPEVRHSLIEVNNPTPSDPRDGGVFGLPWPDFVDTGLPHQSDFGAVAFGAKLHDKEMPGFSFAKSELSARFKFETLGGTMTLNGFYGRQDLPIVHMKGATVQVGSGVNDPNAPGVVNMPVDHNTLKAALWAPDLTNPAATVSTAGNPSGYLPYLRGAAGKGPVTVSPLTELAGCADPVNGTPGPDCSVSIDMELDYTYRQKVVGMSFARDMGDFISFGPKNTSPSIRMELSYEFDKPFNKSLVQPINPVTGQPYVPGQYEFGAVANFVSASTSVVKRDVTSLMLGFDYPLWIPGWDSQQKSIFTSFQWFNIHTEDADHLMAQAPYGSTEVEENQDYLTFLWNAPLDNQRLVLEGLLVKNLDADGTAYRQRVDFNYFGKSWRPRLEFMHLNGKVETAPAGLFRTQDYVELSLTYQF